MKLVTFGVAALAVGGGLLGAGGLIGAAPAHADKMCGSYAQPVQMPDWYECDALAGLEVPAPAEFRGCAYVPFPVKFPVARSEPCPIGSVDTGSWP